ncbi:hypothetical protein CAAN1_05S01156 [[Candida] anglica]|uniref:UBX domain-containing protein n=1 Tax=[Candida] anglica TaxID=148631 RepID=A0ABP0ECM2_9ASCO
MDITESQSEKIQQFRDITGLDSTSEADNVTNLLRINDWNLNNAVSIYFDSGFESITSNTGVEEMIESDQQQSAFNESNVSHRHEDSRSVVNLQSELFLDNYIPKLPKAPKISNQWQLEIGLHMSQRDQLVKNEHEFQSPTPIPKQSNLWIILLIIPKSLLSLLLSLFKLLFGKRSIPLNRFPRKFNYLEYDPDYKMRIEQEDEHINEKEFGNVELQEKEGQSNSSSNQLIEKKDLQLLKEINEKYNSSSFNELYQLSQTKYSWLLVILVNNSEQSKRFLNSFILNESFNKFNENVNIFINNVEKSPEAFTIGETYKVKKLPYVMLCGNVTNNPSIMSSMSIVYKSNISSNVLESVQDVSQTVNRTYRGLNKVMEHFNPQLISQRFDQQEIEFSRMLKDQQDAAYIESLVRDKQKKQEKELKQQLIETELQLAKQRELYLYQKLKSKGWIDSLEDEIKQQNVKLAIKLPDGTRIIEIFSKKIQTKELYLFVELKLFLNDLINSEENEFKDENDVLVKVEEEISIDNKDETWTLDEYFEKFPVRFELIQPFPKKVIEINSNEIGLTKELKNGGNLLVEYLEDEDDGTDEE